MQIVIDATCVDAPVRLEDEWDFGRFAVEIHGGGRPPQDPATLAGVGRWADPGHVFIRPERVRQLAGDLGSDAAWQGRLTGMAAYAASQGWVSADGELRAHVEMVEP